MSQHQPDAMADPSGARLEGVTSGHLFAALGGRWPALVVFALAYAAACLLGYHFKTDLAVPAVLWPAAGVLFSALRLCEMRHWPAVLLVQFGADLLTGFLYLQPFPLLTTLLYAFSNALGAAIGALLARRFVSADPEVRTARSLQMLGATAIGAMAGALPGVWANYRTFDTPLAFLTQLEIWAAGNWLGLAAVVPVVNSWLSPLRHRYSQLALNSPRELVALYLLMALAVWYVFGAADPRPTLLLQVPFVIAALMIYAAYRLPPRWTATLALLTVIACVELTNRGFGPFAAMNVFPRHALLQGFLATVIVIGYTMSTALAEIRISLGDRRESELRYRSLVELSTEAIWRVELDEPMPVSLPAAEQIAWLRRHARLAESNRIYQGVDPAALDPGNGHWHREIPWSAVYEAHIEGIIRCQYAMDGLRFSVVAQGRTHTYLTAFSGVVRDGRLLRIWGVARDVTELTELNARLLREQDRLRSYARQIVTAEEKARRATAIDLHDGIGQSLAGMAMTLNVARDGADPAIRPLIDDVQSRLREVQERTRHMISDLSPPGLYDLGLAPALQWLTVYLRGQDRLKVDLQLDVREEQIPLELRVLVFKLVRELLRNVVKHAAVDHAALSVLCRDERLLVEVEDEGRGFDWQIDMFGGTGRGFGLWSIAERVREAGGEFSVDAAPGRGARFLMSFALKPAGATSGTRGAVRS